MAFSRNHQFVNPKADGPDATITRPSDWNAAFVVSGATVGGIAYFPTATSEAMSGMTWNASAAAGEGLAAAAGTATTDVQAQTVTQTWNNAGVNFTGVKWSFTETAKGSSSSYLTIFGGAGGVTQEFLFATGGNLTMLGGVTASAYLTATGQYIQFGTRSYIDSPADSAIAMHNNAANAFSNLIWHTDTNLSKLAAGSLALGTGAAGSFAGSLKLTTLTHVSAEVDLSYSYNTPTTGTTITTATGEGRTIVNPAGTLAALTITTPPSPVEGQMWGFASSQIITSLTITGTAGATVVGAPASLAVDSNYRWIYRAAITTWLPAP